MVAAGKILSVHGSGGRRVKELAFGVCVCVCVCVCARCMVNLLTAAFLKFFYQKVLRVIEQFTHTHTHTHTHCSVVMAAIPPCTLALPLHAWAMSGGGGRGGERGGEGGRGAICVDDGGHQMWPACHSLSSRW